MNMPQEPNRPDGDGNVRRKVYLNSKKQPVQTPPPAQKPDEKPPTMNCKLTAPVITEDGTFIPCGMFCQVLSWSSQEETSIFSSNGDSMSKGKVLVRVFFYLTNKVMTAEQIRDDFTGNVAQLKVVEVPVEQLTWIPPMI